MLWKARQNQPIMDTQPADLDSKENKKTDREKGHERDAFILACFGDNGAMTMRELYPLIPHETFGLVGGENAIRNRLKALVKKKLLHALGRDPAGWIVYSTEKIPRTKRPQIIHRMMASSYLISLRRELAEQGIEVTRVKLEGELRAEKGSLTPDLFITFSGQTLLIECETGSHSPKQMVEKAVAWQKHFQYERDNLQLLYGSASIRVLFLLRHGVDRFIESLRERGVTSGRFLAITEDAYREHGTLGEIYQSPKDEGVQSLTN